MAGPISEGVSGALRHQSAWQLHQRTGTCSRSQYVAPLSAGPVMSLNSCGRVQVRCRCLRQAGQHLRSRLEDRLTVTFSKKFVVLMLRITSCASEVVLVAERAESGRAQGVYFK